LLFTRQLADRLKGTRVTANALHPGFVKSRFYDAEFGALELLHPLINRFAVSPEQGAETLIYLAASPDVSGVSAQYFVNCRPVRASKKADDWEQAVRLWEVSERIAKTGASGVRA
jgi:NAD(P)-dependent dehydrogenase (short-subunit alcohol dehydrogenase family)